MNVLLIITGLLYMKEDNENQKDNTENSYELFKAAQRDIITINSIIKNEDFRLEDNVETVCCSAAEAVEKMLKAWILNTDKNIKVYGIHDLNKLQNITKKMNNSFFELEDRMIKLNNYTTELRYNSYFTIEEHEVKECLENLKYTYDFPLIKEARDTLNKDNKFNILPDNIGALFGKHYQRVESNK